MYLELLCRGILENLEMQDGEALECCKQSLMGECDGISEDQNVNRTTESKDLAQVSEGKEDSI